MRPAFDKGPIYFRGNGDETAAVAFICVHHNSKWRKKGKREEKLCKIVKMKEKLHCFDWHLINLSSVLLPNSGYHTMLWLEGTHSVLFHSVIILNDTCRKYTFWSEETKTKVISLQWTLKDSSLHSAFFAGISQMKMEMTSETFPCCTWYFLCNVRWLSMMRNYKTYFL